MSCETWVRASPLSCAAAGSCVIWLSVSLAVTRWRCAASVSTCAAAAVDGCAAGDCCPAAGAGDCALGDCAGDAAFGSGCDGDGDGDCDAGGVCAGVVDDGEDCGEAGVMDGSGLAAGLAGVAAASVLGVV